MGRMNSGVVYCKAAVVYLTPVTIMLLGLGDNTIVIYCRDSRSTIVMMIVLFTIVIVVDMIFE